MLTGRGGLVLLTIFWRSMNHNHRVEAAALRKTKKEWEACGTVVTSLCTTMSAGMDEVDARVQKASMPTSRVLAGYCRGLVLLVVSKPFHESARGKHP